MKWLIASDLHGSAYYCEKLVERIESEKVESVFLLGDILYHGPRNSLPGEYDPMKVAAMLNAKKRMITCVRGNCDAEVDQMVLEFPVTSDYSVACYGERKLFFTHGHVYGKDNPPALNEGDVVVYGHVHVQDCEKVGGLFFVNPGSVSIPKNGTPHGYIIFEDGVFYFKDLLTGQTFKTLEI